jgi:hypothetical protein
MNGEYEMGLDVEACLKVLSYHSSGGDRLCGLVFRVPGYRVIGSGFDSRRYQIF